MKHKTMLYMEVFFYNLIHAAVIQTMVNIALEGKNANS